MNWVDRLLLATLLPIFALCFALHVREIARTGLALSPIYAAPSFSGDRYPTVGGRWLERGIGGNDLAVGDRLLRVGERDLRGVGYLRFGAIVQAESAGSGQVPLVYERDGIVRATELRLLSHDLSWFRVPGLLSLALVGTLILLRGRHDANRRIMAVAFLGFAIMESPFHGGSYAQALAADWVFHLFGPAVVGGTILAAIYMPYEVPKEKRLSPHWAWLGALWIVVRLNYFLGGPLPTQYSSALATGFDAVFAVAALATLTWNYRFAPPVGRRRVKWMLYGAYVSVVPLLIVMLAQATGTARGARLFAENFEYAMLSAPMLPIGVLIGVTRFNLFDIDRLIGGTASYTAAFAAFVGAAVLVVPSVAELLAPQVGVDTSWIASGLQLALLAAVVPLQQRLKPQIDRLFFAERLARESGVQQSLADIELCREPREVGELVVDRVESVFQLERCEIEDMEAPSKSSGLPVRVRDDRALTRLLERTPRTHLVEDLLKEAEPVARSDTMTSLRQAQIAVLLPIRAANRLAYVVFLGPQRSGDIYTATDLKLLDEVAAKASAALTRMRDAQIIDRERERSSSLETLRDRAEDANREKTRLIAAASHDLRQPLHALGLFVSALRERARDPEDEELIRRIERSTTTLDEMFEQILDMSRLEAGAMECRVQDVDLHPLIVRIVERLAPIAEAKGVGLRFESAPERVRSDPVLLGRILQNLCGNAVRYTSAGSVTIRCRRLDEDTVVVEVSDTGPGIPLERQADVFREFVRLGTQGGEGGTGLGLAITKRLGDLLGHGIHLESQPGSGSCFSVRLAAALAGSAPAVRQNDGGPHERVPLAGVLIAVVDEDLEILAGIRMILEGWGCEVIVGASGADLLEAVERKGAIPDALLADYRLSEHETGLDVIRHLRALAQRDVSAAVITGETSPQHLEDIRKSGLPCLRKPVPPFKLRSLLMELLRD